MAPPFRSYFICFRVRRTYASREVGGQLRDARLQHNRSLIVQQQTCTSLVPKNPNLCLETVFCFLLSLFPLAFRGNYVCAPFELECKFHRLDPNCSELP